MFLSVLVGECCLFPDAMVCGMWDVDVEEKCRFFFSFFYLFVQGFWKNFNAHMHRRFQQLGTVIT